jgi:rhamnose utilization protein RhaD (predicted bifunctional aldolase and dehydrogenase)
MSIEQLAEVSRYYGADSDYVIAGGGNTSFKDGDTLYIKGSGMALADTVPAAFVRMDRKALADIWNKSYPADSGEREKAVLADLMAARKAGEEQKRPSVETMLHDLLPFAFVVHLHPALVNGLTCSRRGEAAMKEVFPEAIWIPSTNPGYILSLKVKKALEAYTAEHGRPVAIIFLQNHGVFVGADNVERIKEIYKDIMGRLEKKITRRPDFGDEDRKGEAVFPHEIKEISGNSFVFICNREIAALVKDRASFAPVSSAFTPDHIVYAGSDPMFTDAKNTAAGVEAWEDHIAKTGRPPKIAAVKGLGVFGLGATEKAAGLALELFIDAVKVAVYSESFGGPRFMIQEQIDFINNWEVEQFRSKVSTK